MTRRSGRSVSSMAKPSRRNSGFQATSISVPSGASAANRSRNRTAVPAGTVDLPTIRTSPVRCGPSPSATASRYPRSAAYSPFFCGVFTQTKCTAGPGPAAPNRATSA